MAEPGHDVGEWIAARNLAADVVGSIHDDAEARRRGLPGGLVPGNVQLVLVQRGVVDALGAAWYERGVLRFVWDRPVYDGEELRLTIEPTRLEPGDERAIRFRLEKRDGTPAASGTAHTARSPDQLVAPWTRVAAPPRAPTPDPLPEEPVGLELPERTLTLGARDVDGALAGLDPSAWYRETSPWGQAILPTVAFLPFTGQGRRRRRGEEQPDGPARPSPLRAGMNGALELVQSGPMYPDRPYLRRMVVVEKGYGRRTAFRTLEISLEDADGRRAALARWRVNWFA